MDLAAEYYLQTVDLVFIKHALPKGEMTHRGKLVDPSKITRVALMTVEGEKDDISGLGQTEATHTICSSIPNHRRVHYVQKGVGITASSTDRASNRKSCRASPIS
jgi:poly(3-hydroxybutyrate) depolymerase